MDNLSGCMKMNLHGRGAILIEFVNGVREIWFSVGKIDEATNQLSKQLLI